MPTVKKTARRIAFRELAASGPVKPIAPPPEFVAQEERNAGYDLTGLRLANWLRALVKRNASPNEILGLLSRRMAAGQSTPEEGLVIINDLGRRPANARLIKSILTDKLLSQISARASTREPG